MTIITCATLARGSKKGEGIKNCLRHYLAVIIERNVNCAASFDAISDGEETLLPPTASVC